MAATASKQNPASLPVELVSLQRAEVLWHVFSQRVEPLARVMYRWALDELRTKSTDIGLQSSLSATQHALVNAIYYISANSLTDDESMTLLQQPRGNFLAKCQAQCEDALLCTNIFCMDDLDVIRAVILYTVGAPFA
jgi:hypothetical protein